MTCDPERVTGYLDGALPAEESVTVETHLAACDPCRDQLDFERSLRARLREMPPVSLPDGLADRVGAGLLHQRRRPRRRLVTVLGLAAAAALALVWLRNLPSVVAWEMAWDHNHCLGAAELKAEIWTDHPQEVTSWFTSKGYRMPAIPDAAAGLELTGARRCPWPDLSKVAHLYYTAGEGRVSFFVLDRKLRTNTYQGQSRGHAVRILRLGGVTVGLVGADDATLDAFARTFETLAADAELQAAPKFATIGFFPVGL